MHTCYFTQYIVYQYLIKNDIDAYIRKILHTYGTQCKTMLESIKTYFSNGIESTKPEGGMFLWVTLPEGMPAIKLFALAVKENVVFVPGDPFYIDKKEANTLRLNFSCVDCATIETGIRRPGGAINMLQNQLE